MKMRKFLAWLLIFAMAFSTLLFTSCKDDNPDDDDDDVPEEDLSPTFDGDVKKYKGSFNILTRTDGTANQYGNVHDMVAENNLGDAAIVKVVRERNQRIEDNFGIKIKRTKADKESDTALNAVQSDSTTYDAFRITVQAAINLACQGGVMDLYQAPYMDVTADWWDKGITENLLLAGGAYIAIGDILTGDKDSTYLTLFNEKLLEEYGLGYSAESLYALTTQGIGKSGGLTMAKLVQLAAEHATADTNNRLMFEEGYDGIGNYGLYTQSDIAKVILLSAGFTPTKVDSKDISGLKANLTVEFEAAVNEVWRYFGNVSEESWFVNLDKYQGGYNDFWNLNARGSFKANRATFFMCHCGTIDLIRDMQADFGVLPIPKLYDTQEDYASTLQYMNCPAICVPNRGDTLNEKSSYILEAMCYYSSQEYAADQSLNYNYYYRVLRAKGVRDQNAWKMLDLIFDNRVYDLVFAVNIGGVDGGVLNAMVSKNATSFNRTAYSNLDTHIAEKLKTLVSESNG